MAQNIEFYLHPPSPKQSVTRLPPVSSLLQEGTMSSSCSLSSISSYNSTDLPSISNLTSSISNYSLTETTSLPSLSPIMNSLSLDSPPSWLLLPPPINRSRSLSISSTHSIPNDPVIFEEEDTKRKRGRPPNQSKQHVHQRDSYTFVTPTVCDIKQHKEIEESPVSNQDYLVLHWPQQQNGENTFTNTNMDTTLSIPKKKRGRKPKMQLAGNFCFVWRDLTARRGANKNKKIL